MTQVKLCHFIYNITNVELSFHRTFYTKIWGQHSEVTKTIMTIIEKKTSTEINSKLEVMQS